MTSNPRGKATSTRVALVLSGGGARGAYEAGVLSYLFERVYPRLPRGFEFDIVSGTSVGAIHAGFVAASADLEPAARAKALVDTWAGMELDHVMRLSTGEFLGVPLRALGMGRARPRRGGSGLTDVIGGLVDISPLEKLVEERIPWKGLRGNLAAGRPRMLCVSCTDIHTGLVTVFVDGEEVDTSPWDDDSYAQAIQARIDARHVRASAAIPFLFPAVRIGNSYYLDGGLRVNTPLSPALRLGAGKVLVVGLKVAPSAEKASANAKAAITQPAFVLGKMLNVLILDQLEHELRRMETVNTILAAARDALGSGCIDAIRAAIGAKRGLEYRPVESVVVRPSRDIGALAAECHRGRSLFSRNVLSELLARMALRGVPDAEADLFSYLYFDASFARPLIELGRADAARQEDEILDLLS
jgi:NTE family protein